MHAKREVEIWFVTKQTQMKKEVYKKLKDIVLKKKPTPKEFADYCDQEVNRLNAKYKEHISKMRELVK